MKIASLALIYLLSFIITVNAQLPNPSFENWNSIPYEEPDFWFTANKQAVQFAGIVPVTQVAGFSGSAVRMETTLSGNDTIGAFISNTAGDPILGEGGLPYNQQAIGITGYYRYQLQASDTALLLVTFKNNGAIISTDLFKITGTQNTFTLFSFALTVAGVPDTVIIAAASSNLVTNAGVSPGSFLELDQLAFIGLPGIAPIPGGNFDTWNNFIFETPLNWTALSNGISKTPDSYAGSYALRLETMDYGNGNISPGAVTTGNNPGNGPAGGIPYTLMSDTLTGYYKYAPSGQDSAAIGVTLSTNGNPVGGGGYFLTTTTVYTYFEIPFSAFSIPDTLRIDIFSSKFPFLPSSVGSVLLVDNLQLKSQSGVGISEYENIKQKVVAYPNPANQTIQFCPNINVQDKTALIIYDASGKKIREEIYKNNGVNIQLNISMFQIGLYHYQIIGNNFQGQGKFVKE